MIIYITIFLASVSLMIFGVVTGCSPHVAGSDSSNNMDKIYTVRQSDLVIGTLLRGTANAKEKHKLFAEASFKNILTWIQEENTRVKKGDVVIKFETQNLLDDIDTRNLKIESQEKTLQIEKEEKRILLSENQSVLRAAADAVVAAEEDYARYYRYDGKKLKEGLEEAVESNAKALKQLEVECQKMAYEISNTIYDDEDAKETALAKVDALEDGVKKKERVCEDSDYQLRIFKKYTFPNALTDKKNKLEQTRLDHEKIKIRTASKVIQKDNEIQRLENELANAREDLERIESYLPMMEVEAPVDGIMLYGNVDERRNRITIELGMECGRKRVLATIPEMDNLVIDFELPEQFHHRVKKDAKVILTPDSMPTLKLSGHVSEIAVVPVNQIHWDSSSPKIYNSVITLDEQNENFVSGMNVEVNVIEKVLKNAVNIPVEAVFEEDGDYFVYLKTGSGAKKRSVELGKSTDRYVHIIKGLKAGEDVYLYSPYE
ncbi:MAG: hypothetical protein PF904_07280 [Kiritimatiellae bacterium]|nr:hypothetical protein [Kiritimatiellia bacterium]